MLLLALCITTTQAQEKLWEINLNEKLYKVGWIEQTNDGLILANGDKTRAALYPSITEKSHTTSDPLQISKTTTI
jgi:hypothetical protein